MKIIIVAIILLGLAGCKTIPVGGSVSVGALGGIIDVTIAGSVGDGEFSPEVNVEVKDDEG
jgi:hypothetical protein